MDKVAEVGANGNPAAEVVIALDQLPPQRAVGVFDESEAQRLQIGDAALESAFENRCEYRWSRFVGRGVRSDADPAV